MKKLITLLAVIAFGFGANAQDYKPAKGTITTEVGVAGGLGATTVGLNEGIAKFRYFFKDDFAFRLGLGFASTSVETTNVVILPATVTKTSTQKTSDKSFALGVEKHFKGTDRLSTFVGADLLISFSGASQTNANSDGTFVNLTGASDINGGIPQDVAGSAFGLRVVTGADYYIAKKLYLGVEVGLAYFTGGSDAVSTSVKATPSGSTVDTTLFNEGNVSQTNTNIVGGIKIGYQF